MKYQRNKAAQRDSKVLRYPRQYHKIVIYNITLKGLENALKN